MRPAGAKIPEGIAIDRGISEDDAVAVALSNNAALQYDMAALGLAEADLADAGLLRNPTLQLLLPIGYTQFEMLLNLPGEILWQRPRRVAAAKVEVDRVARLLEQSGLNLVRDVRAAYVDLERAQDRVRFADEAVALRKELEVIAEARRRAGDLSDLEANASRVDRSVAEFNAARLKHELTLARNRLCFLLGLIGEEGVLQTKPRDPSPASLPSPAPFSSGGLETLLADAAAHRPDLRAAALAIEAAAKRAKWERTRLFALAELLSIKKGGGLDFSPRPGVLTELPVFHRNKGGIARADAEVERASRQYLAVRHQIALEVKDAFAQFRQSHDALMTHRAGTLRQTAAGVELARKSYEAGDEPHLFVLEATRQWLDARLGEAELIHDLRRAAAQFDRSLGRKHDAKP